MRNLSILWIIPFACVVLSSSAGEADSQHDTSLWTTGTVQRLEMEGGFFGLFIADGKKLFPMHLPEAFKKDGLAVRFRYRELNNVVSIQMWGTSVAILDIEEIDHPPVSPDSH